MDDVLKIDQNNKSTTGFVTDDSNQFIRNARIDDTTKGLKVMVVGSSSGLVAPVILNNATLSSAFTINQTNIANSSSELVLNNAGTGHALQIIQTGNTSSSTSVGGAVLLTNTGNLGSGLVIYSDAGVSTSGARLLSIRADNVLFDQAVVAISNDGTGAALSINGTGGIGVGITVSSSGTGTNHTAGFNYTGTSATAAAGSFTSSNTAFTTLQISGHEFTHGTIKLSHVGDGLSSDGNAAGISIDLQNSDAGTGTTAGQGIFITSTTGGTTGKLLQLKNNLLAFGGADAQVNLFDFTGNGKFGMQHTTPTAFLHLAPGTATATTAPLKFVSGTNLSTTEAGAIEFDGTHLYFTALDAGARYQLDHPVNRNQLRITGNGLITETYPLNTVASVGLSITQTVYYELVGLFKGDIVTNVHVALTAVGTTTTSVFAAILDSSGNRLAVSNDLTTILDSGAGMKTLALSAPYTILADGAYYLAVLVINTTPANCPTFARGNGTSTSNSAVGSGVRAFAAQAGQTTIPTTATFSNSSFAYWMAAS